MPRRERRRGGLGPSGRPSADHTPDETQTTTTTDAKPAKARRRHRLGADARLALFVVACMGAIALLVAAIDWMGPADYGTVSNTREELTAEDRALGSPEEAPADDDGAVPYFPMPIAGNVENVYAYDASQLDVIDHQPLDDLSMGPESSALDEQGKQTYRDMLWALQQGKRSFVLQDASEASVSDAWPRLYKDQAATMHWLWRSLPYWYGHGVTIDGHLVASPTGTLADGQASEDADFVRRDLPLDLGGDGRVLVTFDVGASDAEVAEEQQAMDGAYAEYAAWFDEGNDSAYERAIHAYEHVINTCEIAKAGDEELGDDPSGGQSARSALVNRRATSAGYANAITYLLQRSAIPCWTVWGSRSGSDHAWNVVCIDGTWFYLDAAAGDLGNSTSESDHIRKFDYSRFGMTDADLATAKYEVAHPEWYPVCDSDRWNWFAVNGRRFDVFDADVLVALSREYLEKGWDNLSVQYTSQEAYDEAQGRVSNLSISRGGHSNLWFRSDPVLRTVTIVWG